MDIFTNRKETCGLWLGIFPEDRVWRSGVGHISREDLGRLGKGCLVPRATAINLFQWVGGSARYVRWNETVEMAGDLFYWFILGGTMWCSWMTSSLVGYLLSRFWWNGVLSGVCAGYIFFIWTEGGEHDILLPELRFEKAHPFFFKRSLDSSNVCSFLS